MCRRVNCRSCGKPGWSGCGAHVDAVLGDVPESDRCHCAEEKAASRSVGASKTSLRRRLFGG